MRRIALVLCAVMTPVLLLQTSRGDETEGGQICPTETGPDVIVGGLPNMRFWGDIGGMAAYSVATTSCNIGDEVLPWYDMSNQHPVIAQNMYKLTPTRVEQIGLSWVKHGWGSAQGTFCCNGCIPDDFFHLGVGCSDPYCANLNGDQDGFNGVAGLGPRSEVNAATGEFPWPYGSQGQSGGVLYKRIQVETADLDPALNPDTIYFVEGHYVTPHDSAAGNHHNNASHRQIDFTGKGPWDMDPIGPMYVMEPGIFAWANNDPNVQIEIIDIPDDGRIHVASNATQNPDGTWHYEYAIHNLSSDRSVRGLVIPLPDGISPSNWDFHDVEHHSGEPYSGLDWTGSVIGGDAIWQGPGFQNDPNANAIRWGTMYNFAFDADSEPGPVTAEILLFKPGTPANMNANIVGPIVKGAGCIADLDGSGQVNTADLLLLLSAWGSCPGLCSGDLDNDGSIATSDLLILLAAWGPC